MLFNKRYELTIGENYVSDWGVAEAVREIFQNAIDSPAQFDYFMADRTLTVTSEGEKLTIGSLLLGTGTKVHDPDSIGKFGEGYKIAMLVLVRLGYSVQVYNYDRLWTASIEPSKQFGGERVLVIRESGLDWDDPHGGVTFRIHGLKPGDRELIKECSLRMQPDVDALSDNAHGRILLNRPGKLYVDGLFVCDIESKYGYDLHPSQIQLERDRRTVSSFDLKFLAKDLWFRLIAPEKVAAEMEAGAPELEYAKYGAPEVVKEACYRLFQDKHPGAVAASSQQELDTLVKGGMERVVLLNNPFGDVVRSSTTYRERAPVAVMSIRDELKHWFDHYGRKQLDRRAKEEFRGIINKSEKWRKT